MLLIAASMPTGVEHPLAVRAFAVLVTLIAASMPTGVEHLSLVTTSSKLQV